MSNQYQDARRNLAAVLRWSAREGFQEAAGNHCSLSVSEDGSRFLINPDGRYFSTLKASDLVLMDLNEQTGKDAANLSAWLLHGRILQRVDGAKCVLHLHPKYATVISTLADSTIYPIDQVGMRFYERIGFDNEFSGMIVQKSEADRLCDKLRDKQILIMGNHGVTVVGATVAQAFDELYHLERACETLVTAYMTGQPLRVVSDDVAGRTSQHWQDFLYSADLHFAEFRKVLDREEPDYAD
jgi:ribulose-5-phosphate 4-epimerase/fuculose-1-phosphate aldolase